jgi:hypothetical protein
MKELIKKENSKKMTNSSSSLRESKGFFIKKTLNPLYAGLAIVGYTAITMLVTIKLIGSNQVIVDNSKDYDDIKNEIITEIKKANQLKSGSSNRVSMKNEMELLRSDIIDQVNKINIKYIELVENKKKEYSKVISDLSERKPASISTGGKAIPYNQINDSLLTFKFQKRIDREKERLRKNAQDKIASLDLTRESDVEKMKNIQDDTEFAIYELKQRMYQKKADFRKNKYIVLND